MGTAGTDLLTTLEAAYWSWGWAALIVAVAAGGIVPQVVQRYRNRTRRTQA